MTAPPPRNAPIDPVNRLRGRIDAAVVAARTGAVAGLAGRLGCVAASIVVVVAAIDLALRRPGFWAGGSLVAAGVAVAAGRLLADRRRWFTDRLRIARAIEATHPHLGESVSRAIGFLDDVSRAAASGGPQRRESVEAVTRGLQAIAVGQAADAVEGLGRLPVPGLRGELCWAVAGVASIAAVWGTAALQPLPWGLAVRRQLAPATTLLWPDRGAVAGPAVALPPQGAEAVTEATVAAWTRLESLRRLADASAAAQAAGRPVAWKELRSGVRVVRDEAVAAAAGAADGAAVLHAFAAELGRLELPLAEAAGDEATALAVLRRSLDSLSSLATAAAGIADASVLQTRLAAMLQGVFGRQPGLLRDELAPSARDELDRIATLQVDASAGIASDAAVIGGWADRAGNGAAALRGAADTIEDGLAVALRRSAGDIAANRLAGGSAAAARAAVRLAAAAAVLGMPALDATGDRSLPRPASRAMRPLAELARLQAIDELAGAAEASGMQSPGEDGRSAVAPDGQRAAASDDRAGADDAATAGARAAAGGGGGAGSAADTRPRDARGGRPGIRRPAAQDRVWDLLPERARPAGIAADDVPVPPSHRAAVDAYFESLLESNRPRGDAL